MRLLIVLLLLLIVNTFDHKSFIDIRYVTSNVRVTYYNIHGTTATNVKTKRGGAAISRDLEKIYPMGTKIRLQCKCPFNNQYYIINDRTKYSIKNTIDIFSLADHYEGVWSGKILKIN